MGRPSNSAERRAQIVTGLGQVLATQGYAGATIADIGRAAGLAPGLVHYHFKDKRAVLLALVDDLVAKLRERVARREGRAKSAAQRLTAFLDAAVALGPDAEPAVVACWVSVSAEAVADAEVRAVLSCVTAPLWADLRARVRAALREAGRPGTTAPAQAALLWSAIQGSYLIAVTTPGVIPPGSMAKALRSHVDAMLHREAP